MELQNTYASFQQAGAEVVAVAVTSSQALADWCQRVGLTYPMLADADHAVSEAYGVYNLYGDGLAASAVFVINTDGRIIWQYVGANPADQPGVLTILEHVP